MLNKFLNNTLNKSSGLLSEAKEKVEETAKKKINNVLGDKIPNPQDLQTELQNKLNNPTQEQLLEAERIYNRFLNLVNVAIFKLEAKKAELQSIKAKLEGISSNLQAFRDFANFLDPVLKGLRVALPTIDGSLAASTALAANGKVISSLTLKKKDIKDSLKKASDAIQSFESPADYFVKESNKILNPVDKAIEKIDSLINFLSKIKAQLEAIYTQFLSDIGVLITSEESEETEGDSTTIDDAENNPDLLDDLITTTISPNNKGYVIKKNGATIEYGIGNPPTNEITSDESGR